MVDKVGEYQLYINISVTRNIVCPMLSKTRRIQSIILQNYLLSEAYKAPRHTRMIVSVRFPSSIESQRAPLPATSFFVYDYDF